MMSVQVYRICFTHISYYYCNVEYLRTIISDSILYEYIPLCLQEEISVIVALYFSFMF